MTFDWTQFLIITVIMAIGAALQGSVGYGMGMLTTPFLLLINPRLIPAPFIVAASLLILLMVWREHQAIDLFGLRWVLTGSLPGTILGTALLTILPQRDFNIAFGVVLILAVLMGLGGIRFPMRRLVLVIAGFISGIMAVLGGINGPPVALVYQDASPERLRSTISGFFIVSTVITLSSLAVAGRFGWQEIGLSAIQIPGVLLGFLCSTFLVRRIGGATLRPYILAISAAAGVLVIGMQFIS